MACTRQSPGIHGWLLLVSHLEHLASHWLDLAGTKGCIKMRGTGPPGPSNPILRICLDYLGGKGLGLVSEGRWMGEGGWGEEEEEGGKDS